MKKHVSLFLVAAVMLLASNLLAKERPGAAVVLTMKDGREVKGELFAVKGDSIVVVDPQGQSATVAVADVVQLRLKKRIGRSVRTGAIIGSVAVASFLLGLIIANSDGGTGAPQTEEIAALSAFIVLGGAVPGGLVGWMAGGASSTKTVRIEGLSAESLQRVLTKLRKSARVRNYR